MTTSLRYRAVTARALFGVALLVAPTAAWASLPTDVAQQRLMALLRQSDREPTLADFERVGPEANRLLVEVVENPTLAPSERLRALSWLAWFPSRRSEGVLRTYIHTTKMHPSERTTAMTALGRAFGCDAVAELRNYVDDADLALRGGAARALAATACPRARTLLEHRVGREPNLELRLELERLIAGTRW